MNPNHCAVLIIDMQNDFLTSGGLFKHPISAAPLLRALAPVLEAARSAQSPIVWITRAYPERSERPAPMRAARPDAPRFADAPQNSDLLASGHAGRPCCRPGSDGAQLWAPLSPHVRPEDLQLQKHRYSAFMETDLQAQLQARGVRKLYICGVVSNVCVRATACDGFFLGFDVVGLSDAIGATSGAKKREGLSAIERWYGEVQSCAELLTDYRHQLRGLGAGDSALWYGALSPALIEGAFEALREEISWQHMLHRGSAVPRLISIQGTQTEDGVPIYRHPADAQPELQPWTPTADKLRRAAGALLGQDFNHALIQRYLDGRSYISHHADKTLDVARGSAIVNLSLGASRTMTLIPKRAEDKPQVQRLELLHNSLFALGWKTNQRYLHGIKRDKRQPAEKRPDELRFGGERISLTLRTIATFMRPEAPGKLHGQGAAKAPRQDSAAQEALRMLEAFGRENKEHDFDWEQNYGGGFDALNFQLISER